MTAQLNTQSSVQNRFSFIFKCHTEQPRANNGNVAVSAATHMVNTQTEEEANSVECAHVMMMMMMMMNVDP